MKKLFILLFLLIPTYCWALPSNSISIPNSFTPNTTISSSSVNANNNEVQTKFNVHSHTDITQVGAITAGTWGGNTVGTSYGGTGITTKIISIATYTGDGLDNKTVAHGLGTTPTYVRILKNGGESPCSWITGMTVGNSLLEATGNITALGIKSVGATNITLGTHNAVNASGGSYSAVSMISQ